MHNQSDPFTGIWRFNKQLSKLTTQAPRSWVQEIHSSPDDVSVREHIIRSDGVETVAFIQARFDEEEYPVKGSGFADTITYRRIDLTTISGVGKKNGSIVLTETLAAAPEHGRLTLTYSIHAGSKIIAEGTAVFEKESYPE